MDSESIRKRRSPGGPPPSHRGKGGTGDDSDGGDTALRGPGDGTDSTALAPLAHPVFRALWIALAISTIGTWMHELGAAWLMTSLRPEPVMVALVQAANLAPTFLLALPAGAFADIVDRRRYLLFALSWLMAAAALLGVMTLTGSISAHALLGFTLAMGTGAAMMMPAFAALIPDLVPRNELAAAITLNGIAFNASRAVGPAIAGVVVAASGPGAVFLLNAVSYLAVFIVIYRWRSERAPPALPSERLIGAVRVGLRYALGSTALQVVIARGMFFFVLVAAPLAFLPLIVREQMGAGPEVYGALLGATGAGAVGVGFNLARLRRYFSSDTLVTAGTALTIVATLALAYTRELWLLIPAMVVFGGAWITVLSTLQVVAQLSLPPWVRARGLAVFLASFMGSVALASPLWGKLAALTSIEQALQAAAVLGGFGLLAGSVLSLRRYAEVDATLAPPFPDPTVPHYIDEDRGPVLVELTYCIDPEDAEAFTAAMQAVRRMRRRNGAITWGLFRDTGDEQRFVEIFVDESWVEHLRQHRRVTRGDLEILNRAYAYHRGEAPPAVRHLISQRKR